MLKVQEQKIERLKNTHARNEAMSNQPKSSLLLHIIHHLFIMLLITFAPTMTRNPQVLLEFRWK